MIDLFVEGVSPMHAQGPSRPGVALSLLANPRTFHVGLKHARPYRTRYVFR
jgi:hypothetical protein